MVSRACALFTFRKLGLLTPSKHFGSEKSELLVLVELFIQRHGLFSVPGTVALGPTLRSLASPVRAIGTPFDMLPFIHILLVIHWISAEGKVN
jgi:hypothetical protein